MPALVELARRFAVDAHNGQTDKAGLAYINHPHRVADLVARMYPQAPESAVAAAWLHDVLEDCDVTPVDLALAGFPRDVVTAVRVLTRRHDVSPQRYYKAVRRNPLARMVKHADIADNLDSARLALLDDAAAGRLRRKYMLALTLLGLPIPVPVGASAR